MSSGMAAFFGLFLVFSLIRVGEALHELDELGNHLRLTWNAEYRLQLCGERLALRENFRASAEILRRWFPQSKRGVDAQLTRMRRDLGGADDDLCQEDVLGFTATAYAQENPTLPSQWPNWRVRWRRLRPH